MLHVEVAVPDLSGDYCWAVAAPSAPSAELIAAAAFHEAFLTNKIYLAHVASRLPHGLYGTNTHNNAHQHTPTHTTHTHPHTAHTHTTHTHTHTHITNKTHTAHTQ